MVVLDYFKQGQNYAKLDWIAITPTYLANTIFKRIMASLLERCIETFKANGIAVVKCALSEDSVGFTVICQESTLEVKNIDDIDLLDPDRLSFVTAKSMGVSTIFIETRLFNLENEITSDDLSVEEESELINSLESFREYDGQVCQFDWFWFKDGIRFKFEQDELWYDSFLQALENLQPEGTEIAENDFAQRRADFEILNTATDALCHKLANTEEYYRISTKSGEANSYVNRMIKTLAVDLKTVLHESAIRIRTKQIHDEQYRQKFDQLYAAKIRELKSQNSKITKGAIMTKLQIIHSFYERLVHLEPNLQFVE